MRGPPGLCIATLESNCVIMSWKHAQPLPNRSTGEASGGHLRTGTLRPFALGTVLRCAGTAWVTAASAAWCLPTSEGSSWKTPSRCELSCHFAWTTQREQCELWSPALSEIRPWSSRQKCLVMAAGAHRAALAFSDVCGLFWPLSSMRVLAKGRSCSWTEDLWGFQKHVKKPSVF